MHQITIKYTRCFLPFKIKRQLPSCWAEVTKSQLVNAITYLLEGNQSGVLCEFAHISPATLKHVKPEEVFELVKLIEFTKKPPTYFYIQKIKSRIAPKATLENMSIGQLANCDAYFLAFINEQKEETLNKLIAGIYMLKLMISKKRVWLQELSTETYFLRHLTYAEKLSIFFCYKGAREGLISQFPKVFKREEETTEEQVQPMTQAINPLHLFELIETLSKTGQYGNYEATFKTEAQLIFFNMQISK